MNLLRCPLCSRFVETLTAGPRGPAVADRSPGPSPSRCEHCALTAPEDVSGGPPDVRARYRRAVGNPLAVLPLSLRIDSDARFTGKGVTIAFIDSGFYPHPDLTKPRNRIRAIVDATGERHTVSYFRVPHPESWHGTMSSVIAAGNGYLSRGGYRGVARDSHLVLVKVMDVGSGRVTSDDIARGLDWVLSNRKKYGIRIVSLAVGGDDPEPLERCRVDQLVEQAVKEGIVVVAAAGNSPGQPLLPPASAPSAITVGGIDDHNQLDHSFSTLYPTSQGRTLNGNEKPEIAAPACAIAGPLLPGTEQFLECRLLFRMLKSSSAQARRILREHHEELGAGKSTLKVPNVIDWALERIVAGKYVAPTAKSMEGTSVAASIVAAVAAQMLEANPALTPSEVKAILMQTAWPLPGLTPNHPGFGLVNPRMAVRQALLSRHGLKARHAEIRNGFLAMLFEHKTANSIQLAGDFNGWKPEEAPCHEVSPGQWSCLIKDPGPGTYSYKLVIDGREWIEDPAIPDRVPDGYGGWNTRFTVGRPESPRQPGGGET